METLLLYGSDCKGISMTNMVDKNNYYNSLSVGGVIDPSTISGTISGGL